MRNTFSQLVALERTEYGLLASIYDSGWGGYSFRKMCGYSVSAAIRELRGRGVICPRFAYHGALKKREAV